MSGRVVPAVSTLARLGVAEVGVAVALAGGAAGEPPLAGPAVGALAARGPGPARTLTADRVTLVAQGAL